MFTRCIVEAPLRGGIQAEAAGAVPYPEWGIGQGYGENVIESFLYKLLIALAAYLRLASLGVHSRGSPSANRGTPMHAGVQVVDLSSQKR